MHMNNRLYRKTSPFLRKETFNVYFSIVNVHFFAVNVYFWCLGYYADMEISTLSTKEPQNKTQRHLPPYLQIRGLEFISHHHKGITK